MKQPQPLDPTAQQQEQPDAEHIARYLEMLDEGNDLSGHPVENPLFPAGADVTVSENRDGEEVHYGVKCNDTKERTVYKEGDVLDDLLPDYLAEQFEQVCQNLGPLYQRTQAIAQQLAQHQFSQGLIVEAAKEYLKGKPKAEIERDFGAYMRIGEWFAAEGREARWKNDERAFVFQRIMCMELNFISNVRAWINCGLPVMIQKTPKEMPDGSTSIAFSLVVSGLAKTQDGQELRHDFLTPSLRWHSPSLWLQLFPEDQNEAFRQKLMRKQQGPSASEIINPGGGAQVKRPHIIQPGS